MSQKHLVMSQEFFYDHNYPRLYLYQQPHWPIQGGVLLDGQLSGGIEASIINRSADLSFSIDSDAAPVGDGGGVSIAEIRVDAMRRKMNAVKMSVRWTIEASNVWTYRQNKIAALLCMP